MHRKTFRNTHSFSSSHPPHLLLLFFLTLLRLSSVTFALTPATRLETLSKATRFSLHQSPSETLPSLSSPSDPSRGVPVETRMASPTSRFAPVTASPLPGMNMPPHFSSLNLLLSRYSSSRSLRTRPRIRSRRSPARQSEKPPRVQIE